MREWKSKYSVRRCLGCNEKETPKDTTLTFSDTVAGNNQDTVALIESVFKNFGVGCDSKRMGKRISNRPSKAAARKFVIFLGRPNAWMVVSLVPGRIGWGDSIELIDRLDDPSSSLDALTLVGAEGGMFSTETLASVEASGAARSKNAGRVANVTNEAIVFLKKE